jgi:hypothetical protein
MNDQEPERDLNEPDNYDYDYDSDDLSIYKEERDSLSVVRILTDEENAILFKYCL